MGSRVDLLSRPEPHQHRQECLCHIDPAESRECCYRGVPVWHRHSCLCFGKVQILILLTKDANGGSRRVEST